MSREAGPPCYLNRELSWIEFNHRVLEEASDESHPLLERAKFLAIFATNLDEFFMIRVSGLRELVASGMTEIAADGLTPQQTIDALVKRLIPIIDEHSRAWTDCLQPELARHGIRVLDYGDLSDAQRDHCHSYFREQVYPVLTPLAVDTAHPFPHISNLSLSLAVLLEDGKRERLARVKVPPVLPRLVPLNECHETDSGDADNVCFAWLDQVIAAHIGDLFPGVRVKASYAFRVTRDTDIEIVEDEAGDLLESVESQLRGRRFGNPVRLEVAGNMPDHLRDILTSNLELQPVDVYRIHGPLNLADLMELLRLPLPRLKDAPFVPRTPPSLQEAGTPKNLFEAIQRNDRLLFHPFDSFGPVVEFIRAAADDPLVLAIKITLYRIGNNSPVVQALIDAVEKGKQVAVLVELKARFDEENNIQWARALEDAGVHVVYGIPKLKVHAKVALVVRKEPEGIKRYIHLSTGNYNATTARVYTDIGMFTCDEELGQDATDLFNLLTGYSKQTQFRKLLVAPVTLRPRILALIEREIEQHLRAGGGHIILKLNALIDPTVIDALYRASQAGVRVDLIVRSICSLCPGVPGLSDNIRVISIVGRFLEHSRIFYFHNGGEGDMYLGSADMMQRNLDRRVEVLFPVEREKLRRLIMERVLDIGLRDTVKARELQADGTYRRVTLTPGSVALDSQIEQLHG